MEEGDLSTAASPAVATSSSTPGSGATPSAALTPDGPDRTPSAICINPPTGIPDLAYQSDPLACYGGEDVTVEGYLQGMGAVDCGPLEPAWMACERTVELRPLETASSTGIVLVARGTIPLMTAVLHPSLGLYPDDVIGDAMQITGHYDDPAALTCRYTDQEAAPEDPEAAVQDCRHRFVIVALQPITQ